LVLFMFCCVALALDDKLNTISEKERQIVH
jgi:hypothetical protein